MSVGYTGVQHVLPHNPGRAEQGTHGSPAGTLLPNTEVQSQDLFWNCIYFIAVKVERVRSKSSSVTERLDSEY